MKFENGVIFEGNQTADRLTHVFMQFENGVIFEGNRTRNHPDAAVDDLDVELLHQYAEHIDADNMTYEEVLRAREFLKKQNGREHLTNAAASQSDLF